MVRTSIGFARLCAYLGAALCLSSCGWILGTGIGLVDESRRVVDHREATVLGLDPARVENAKEKLRIAYWHTSHGSQLVDGMSGMDAFYGGTGLYRLGSGGLVLDDHYGPYDLGNPDFDNFESVTRTYLADHPSTNVVIWSWCGEVSGAGESDIDNYLSRMDSLIADYPNVRFVHMTGHADGSGLSGNLHLRNRQIREHCETEEHWLYDFYDIECYDPDGAYYGDKHVYDSCEYDGGHNWAIDWQAAHPDDWWDCSSAHSQPLNANQKAKAAWRLWARLAESL